MPQKAKNRSLRSSARQRSSNRFQQNEKGGGGFEEEAEDESPEAEEEDGNSSSNEDAESTSSEEVEPPPLMVLNRSRRANAGSLMAKLLTEKEIEKKEGDEVYEELWGGFKDVENDHNFEVTAADEKIADEDSNSELDEQDSNEEDMEEEENGTGELGEDGEPKRKKRKLKSNWLLSKMSETTVDENILNSHEQHQRMAQCKKIAERNRQSLEAMKQKQLEEQKKNVIRTRQRHLTGPKEAWYSDKYQTYMIVSEIKQWLPPKKPKKCQEKK